GISWIYAAQTPSRNPALRSAPQRCRREARPRRSLAADAQEGSRRGTRDEVPRSRRERPHRWLALVSAGRAPRGDERQTGCRVPSDRGEDGHRARGGRQAAGQAAGRGLAVLARSAGDLAIDAGEAMRLELIPTVVEQTHRGERGWDIYSRLL